MFVGYAGRLIEQMDFSGVQSYRDWLSEKGFDPLDHTDANGDGELDQMLWRKLFSTPD